MSVSPQKVIVVGLGAAGMDHVRALADIPDVDVIAGIDTDSTRASTPQDGQVALYASLHDASRERIDPGVAVIATPTPTHEKVCLEVSECFPAATILMEKPAAGILSHARWIITGAGTRRPVHVAYHMAFSPEVDWALGEAQARADELGPPLSIESWYADPYQSRLASAQATFGSSWIDSGINALSVIERFAKTVERTSLRDIGPAVQSAFEGTFRCEAGGSQFPAVVLTSWHSTAPTRTTRIKYSDGSELVMDHNAVAGYIVRGGKISAVFGSDGAVPRREAHYRGLYKSWLVDGAEVFPAETSLRLHELLLSGLG